MERTQATRPGSTALNQLGMSPLLVTNRPIEKYLQMLDKHRVRGFLFEQQNYSTASQVATLKGAADPTAAAKNSKKQ